MFTDIPHDYCNEETGLPVKNHLPPELGARFKTRKQWREWDMNQNPESRVIGCIRVRLPIAAMSISMRAKYALMLERNRRMM